jgi:hypothetical protein
MNEIDELKARIRETEITAARLTQQGSPLAASYQKLLEKLNAQLKELL